MSDGWMEDLQCPVTEEPFGFYSNREQIYAEPPSHHIQVTGSYLLRRTSTREKKTKNVPTSTGLAGEAPIGEKEISSAGTAGLLASLRRYGCSIASGGTFQPLRAHFYEPANVSRT